MPGSNCSRSFLANRFYGTGALTRSAVAFLPFSSHFGDKKGVKNKRPSSFSHGFKWQTRACICGRVGMWKANYSQWEEIYSSWAPSAFLAAFFFLFLLVLLPVERAKGRSRSLRISSSSIFLSVWYLERSGALGAARRVIPFLVMAAMC